MIVGRQVPQNQPLQTIKSLRGVIKDIGVSDPEIGMILVGSGFLNWFRTGNSIWNESPNKRADCRSELYR